MLSPDPVTQAPENGQNYNRYRYANNNPLKYSDPSGFYTELVEAGGNGGSFWPTPEGFFISSAISWGFNKVFGSDGCDRTCRERQAAHNWCKAQSWCFDDIQGVREKFRKRSALAILTATQAGLEYSVGKRGVVIRIPVVGNENTPFGDPHGEPFVLDRDLNNAARAVLAGHRTLDQNGRLVFSLPSDWTMHKLPRGDGWVLAPKGWTPDDGLVSVVRVQPPGTGSAQQNPNGYYVVYNANGQPISPYSGRTVGPDKWHNEYTIVIPGEFEL